MKHRRLASLIAVVALVGAACGGIATAPATTAPTGSPTAAPTAAPAATPAPTVAATPARTPTPTPASQAPTIGQAADDGARIIAVESPTTLQHRAWVEPGATGCPADSNPGCWVAVGNPVATTRARDLTIDSPALGIVHARLLLPLHFDAQPSTRWPVLYLHHGGTGKYSDWTEALDVEALTAPTDLLVVMPDAGVGYYSNWWNGGSGGPPAWETFHLVELRQLLERNWLAGDKRAIAGYSMGGYGAMEYATRQPGMFAFAGSYSGPVDPIHGTGDYPYQVPNLWGGPVAQADVWKAHDPTENAAVLTGTALYVAYGNGQPGPFDNGHATPFDPTGDGERNVAAESATLVQRLGELKIPVTVYSYGNGTHSFPYMQRDFERSLPLILKALGE